MDFQQMDFVGASQLFGVFVGAIPGDGGWGAVFAVVSAEVFPPGYQGPSDAQELTRLAVEAQRRLSWRAWMWTDDDSVRARLREQERELPRMLTVGDEGLAWSTDTTRIELRRLRPEVWVVSIDVL